MQKQKTKLLRLRLMWFALSSKIHCITSKASLSVCLFCFCFFPSVFLFLVFQCFEIDILNTCFTFIILRRFVLCPLLLFLFLLLLLHALAFLCSTLFVSVSVFFLFLYLCSHLLSMLSCSPPCLPCTPWACPTKINNFFFFNWPIREGFQKKKLF